MTSRRAPSGAALLLALALAACGDGADGDHPVFARVPPEVDVPRVGTVGDLAADEAVVLVACTRRGDLTLDGRPLPASDLRDALSERARAAPRDADRRSRLGLVLALDRSLPWGVAQSAMVAARSVRPAVHRVFFAVRSAGDGRPGVLATFLPLDRGLGGAVFVPAGLPVVRLSRAPEGEASDPEALAVALAAVPPDVGRYRVVLSADPLVGLDEALRSVDAVFRAGRPGVDFDLPYGWEETVREPWDLVRASRAAGGAFRISVAGATLPEGKPPPPPVPARVVGAPAGDAARWGPSLADVIRER